MGAIYQDTEDRDPTLHKWRCTCFNVGAAVEMSSIRPWTESFFPILCSVNCEVFEMDKVSEFVSWN